MQAAYGLLPVTPADWPEPPPVDPRPDPRDLSGDDIGDGWNEQALFRRIASLMPGARAVLRRITELGGTASFDEVQQYFADHPTTPITKARISGALASVPAVQRRVGPADSSPPTPAGRAGTALPDRPGAEGLRRAFVIADGRPNLQRGAPAAGAT
ncbi:hypothetical protein ACWC5C_22405 [Streptomyces sp. NPDC001700]